MGLVITSQGWHDLSFSKSISTFWKIQYESCVKVPLHLFCNLNNHLQKKVSAQKFILSIVSLLPGAQLSGERLVSVTTWFFVWRSIGFEKAKPELFLKVFFRIELSNFRFWEKLRGKTCWNKKHRYRCSFFFTRDNGQKKLNHLTLIGCFIGRPCGCTTLVWSSCLKSLFPSCRDVTPILQGKP